MTFLKLNPSTSLCTSVLLLLWLSAGRCVTSLVTCLLNRFAVFSTVTDKVLLIVYIGEGILKEFKHHNSVWILHLLEYFLYLIDHSTSLKLNDLYSVSQFLSLNVIPQCRELTLGKIHGNPWGSNGNERHCF